MVLAPFSINREQKQGKDWAEWKPKHNVCWAAGTIVLNKVDYELNMDIAEFDALRTTMVGCVGYDPRKEDAAEAWD